MYVLYTNDVSAYSQFPDADLKATFRRSDSIQRFFRSHGKKKRRSVSGVAGLFEFDGRGGLAGDIVEHAVYTGDLVYDAVHAGL